MQDNEELKMNNFHFDEYFDGYFDEETDYCCICINTKREIFIKLKCCNQSIHESCIIEFITSINNDLYNCPVCRNKLNIQVSFGKLIDYINEKSDLISIDKIQSIISHLYKDIQIKDLFNINDSAEIEHLKKTVTELTIKNNRFRLIIIILSLPVIIIICAIIFPRLNN